MSKVSTTCRPHDRGRMDRGYLKTKKIKKQLHICNLYLQTRKAHQTPDGISDTRKRRQIRQSRQRRRESKPLTQTVSPQTPTPRLYRKSSRLIMLPPSETSLNPKLACENATRTSSRVLLKETGVGAASIAFERGEHETVTFHHHQATALFLGPS